MPEKLQLFSDDHLHAILRTCGLEKDGPWRALARFSLPFLVGGMPVVLLAAIEGHFWGPTRAQSIAWEFAGLGQMVSVCLLLFAERELDGDVRSAGQQLATGGLVRDLPKLSKATLRLARVRRLARLDVGFLLVSWAISCFWLGSELRNSDMPPTWRVSVDAGQRHLTMAALWAGAIGLPLFNYMWLRWTFRLFGWAHFLYDLSALNLQLRPAHPDRAGGLGFLGTLQARFGMVIFAVGIAVAANVLHASAVDGVALASMQVGGLMIFYIVLAPILFLLPMLTLRSTLRAAKTRGLMQYSIMAHRKLRREAGIHATAPSRLHPSVVGIGERYEAVRSMRVIPMDLKSIAQLFASAGAPMLPLLPRFLPWPEVQRYLEVILGR